MLQMALCKVSFNSMKVRLKPEGPTPPTEATRFQFHEGPIKTVKTGLFRGFSILFQFHEGPIKTSCRRRRCVCGTSFNSMKVRLKRVRLMR